MNDQDENTSGTSSPTQFSFVIGKGNKRLILRRGNQHTLHHTLKDGAQMWSCTSKRTCKAKLKVLCSTILREDPHTCVTPRKKASNIGRKTQGAKKAQRKRERERQLIQEQQGGYQYGLTQPESGYFMPQGGRYSQFGGLWGGLLPEESLTEPKPLEEVKIEPLVNLEPPVSVKLEFPVPVVLEPPVPVMLEPPVPVMLEPPVPVMLEPPVPVMLEPPVPVMLEPPVPVKLEPPTVDDGVESTAASGYVEIQVKAEPCDAAEENSEVLDGQVDSSTAATDTLLRERGSGPDFRLYKNGRRRYRLHQCPYCDYRSHTSGIASHIGMHTNFRQFSCHLCEFRTNYSHALERHVRRHRHKKKAPSPNKRFQCPHCRYVAKYANHLKSHILGKHSIGMPFACDHCDYSTKYARSLRRHFVSLHMPKSDQVEKKTPDKMFQCDHCAYNTHQRRCIMNHLVKHSENQFKCVFCEYVTKHVRALRRHMQTRHAAETAIFFASTNKWSSVASENTDNVAEVIASSNIGSSFASGRMDNLNNQGGSVASEGIDDWHNHDEPECIISIDGIDSIDKERVESDPLQDHFIVNINVKIEQEE